MVTSSIHSANSLISQHARHEDPQRRKWPRTQGPSMMTLPLHMRFRDARKSTAQVEVCFSLSVKMCSRIESVGGQPHVGIFTYDMMGGLRITPTHKGMISVPSCKLKAYPPPPGEPLWRPDPAMASYTLFQRRRESQRGHGGLPAPQQGDPHDKEGPGLFHLSHCWSCPTGWADSLFP